MNFHGIDLNLLVAFDALMGERNVTRAAAQVGVSQPAMSASLSRLRKLLGDPLFLRSADGLLPTQMARDLAEPISQVLRRIETTLVKKPVFQPETASLPFNLGLSDYPAFVLLPSLMRVLSKEAPQVKVSVHAFDDRDHAIDLLDAGAIDAAIGVAPTHTDSRIMMRAILRDEFVTILAHNHPAARRGMNMKTYLSLAHILVSPEGDRHGLVDQVLAEVGKKRVLGLTLPQMFAAPDVVARTTMTATILKRIALNSSANRRLALFPPPITLPEIVFHLIWHRRSDVHSAQQWFRALIEATAGRL